MTILLVTKNKFSCMTLKREIYFAVVDEEAILDSTGFTRGTLPILYILEFAGLR